MVKLTDGVTVIELTDGVTVIDLSVGVTVIELTDGVTVMKLTDGVTVIDLTDGVTVIDLIDGVKVIELTDGVTVIELRDEEETRNGVTVIKLTGGVTVRELTDGVSVTELTDGVIVVELTDDVSVIERPRDEEDVIDDVTAIEFTDEDMIGGGETDTTALAAMSLLCKLVCEVLIAGRLLTAVGVLRELRTDESTRRVSAANQKDDKDLNNHHDYPTEESITMTVTSSSGTNFSCVWNFDGKLHGL